MKNRGKNIFLAVLLIGAIAAMVPQAAMALGTTAGTVISNSATAAYTVGGVSQTPITSAAATFNVDKKIIFSVTASNKVGAGALATTPSTTGNNTTNVITYTISNTGNTAQDFKVTMAESGATFAFGAGTPKYYYNTSNVMTAGTNTLISTGGTIPAVPKDTNIYLFSVVDIPATALDTQTRDIAVTAVSVDGVGAALVNGSGSAGTGSGVVIANAGNANTAADTGEYKIVTATIGVSKSYTITAGPVEAPGILMAVPGATVHYSITVANTGLSDATSVTVTDAIPANMTYVAASLSAPGASASSGSQGGGISVTYATLVHTTGTATFTFDCTIN